MLVACYYTNDAYKAMAERMTASARLVGLEAVGYFIENKGGSWRDGDCMKPDVVLRVVKEHPKKSVLFVDADCYFRGYPELLDEKTHDHEFACYFDGPTKPYSTVLWLRAGAGVRYAECWAEQMRKYPNRPNDIIALRAALESLRPRRVMHLPPAYCWTEVWLRKRFGSVKPIIEHFAVGEHSFVGNVYERTPQTLYKN